MSSTIQRHENQIHFENEYISARFNTLDGFGLNEFRVRASDQLLGAGLQQTLLLDRTAINLAHHKGTEVHVRDIAPLLRDEKKIGTQADVVITLPLPGGGRLTIERQFSLYDHAGALRWVDTWSSDTALHGLRYSDLFSFQFSHAGAARAVDFFNCSDQSNERVREFPAVAKNRAGFFLHSGGPGLFIYKEGPSPDSQPIPTEYDFVYDEDAATVSMVGLGFDDLRPGEQRRANGAVIGLLEDETTFLGLKRYQHARYRLREQEPAEFLCNSWPAFRLQVSEEKIRGELEIAGEIGAQTVFIDDGWFDLFMDQVSDAKFPKGLAPLAERAKELGLNLGLWVNPLGLDSQHPNAREWDGAECFDTVLDGNKWNWVARSDNFTPVEKVFSEKTRIYHSMDLLNPEYFEHIRSKLIAFYADHGIRRFKFDLYQLNKYNTLLGDAHLHYEAYRRLLEELHQAIPGLIVSMDVTRRNRPCFDFGMDYGRLFLENRGRGANLKDHRYYHPYTSLGNLWRVARFIPAGRCELEMMPQIDDYPLEYILATTLFAHPLYWGTLAALTPEKQRAIRVFMDRIAPHKHAMLDNLVFPFGEAPAKNTWCGFLSSDASGNEGYVAIYRNGTETDHHSFTLPLIGKEKKIHLQDLFEEERSLTLSGGTAEFQIEEPYGFRFYRFHTSPNA